MDLPVNRHGIVLRRDALAHAHTDNHLGRYVATGKLQHLWPGAYLPTPGTELSPTERHRLQALAAATVGRSDAVLSHQSAAVIHGLSLLFPDLDRVHFATGLRTGGRLEARRHLHAGTLDEAHVTTVDGVAVTTLEKTAVDLACSSNFAAALAVFDSALRHRADRDEMAVLLAQRRRGVAVARRALGYADPKSENAGEAWGRAQMIDAGLPVPVLQREFFAGDGKFIARPDFAWEEVLVGEFDGLVKYQKYLRPGETPLDALIREKAREDALRRIGIMVVRWVWADLRAGKVVPMVREWLEHFGLI